MRSGPLYLADLSPIFDCPSTLAVGWLSGAEPFPTGPCPPEIFTQLRTLLRDPIEPFVAGGWHECDLCQFDGPRGGRNLYLPGEGCLYVCPELITHAIAAHHSLPPAESLAAVAACPPPRTRQYRVAFLENGGRELIRRTRLDRDG